MSDYRIEAATKEEWAERALRAEAKLAAAKYEIDFCHAQLEAWQSMAPPATKGLLRKRLAELKGDT